MLSLVAFAPAFVPPTVMLTPHTQARATAVNMNFFDDMMDNMKKFMDPDAGPTYEEAVELCRDDESVGCTVEMCAPVTTAERITVQARGC